MWLRRWLHRRDPIVIDIRGGGENDVDRPTEPHHLLESRIEHERDDLDELRQRLDFLRSDLDRYGRDRRN